MNHISETLPIGNPFPVDGDTRRYDPISAIVGVGSSLIGGLIKKNAASSAADLQSKAAADAGKQVTDATNAVNPTITQAAKDAGTAVTGAATTAGQGVTDAAGKANLLLDPYASTGAAANSQLAAGVAQGGQFNKVPTLADIQIDPGYAFREQQGELAQQRLASARGGVQGGGAAKALENYAQGNASQEYAAAYQRFKDSTQQRFNNLNTLSQSGQTAAGTQGSNLLGAAQYSGTANLNAAQFGAGANINAANLVGSNSIDAAKTSADYLTQGANAEAAGKVAGANAIGGAISGAGSAVTGGIALKKILQNPAQKINLIQPYPLFDDNGAVQR